MSIGTLIITLVVVGIVLWLINSFVPMDQKIKQILNVVIVIFVIFWILRYFGLFSHRI